MANKYYSESKFSCLWKEVQLCLEKLLTSSPPLAKMLDFKQWGDVVFFWDNKLIYHYIISVSM